MIAGLACRAPTMRTVDLCNDTSTYLHARTMLTRLFEALEWRLDRGEVIKRQMEKLTGNCGFWDLKVRLAKMACCTGENRD